jgi:hypothetical protein
MQWEDDSSTLNSFLRKIGISSSGMGHTSWALKGFI